MTAVAHHISLVSMCWYCDAVCLVFVVSFVWCLGVVRFGFLFKKPQTNTHKHPSRNQINFTSPSQQLLKSTLMS